MAYALITLDDVKEISKGKFGSEFDYLLSKIIIPWVGESIADFCGRPDFDKVERIVYFSPRANQQPLLLNCPPIFQDPLGSPAIPNVQVWQNADLPRAYAAADLLVNGVDYLVHEDEGIIEHVSGFVGGPKTVKVTYTGGYLTANGEGTPAAVRGAMLLQTTAIFNQRDKFGLSSYSSEGSAATPLPPLILPLSVQITLGRYKLVRL